MSATVSTSSARKRPSASSASVAVGHVVATLRIAEEMLAALGYPPHRLSQPLRRYGDQRVLAIRKELGAEAAAHVGRHHPHPVARDLEDVVAQNVADRVAALAGERQRDAVAVGLANDSASVEIVGDEALVDHRERNGARGIGESLPRCGRIAKRRLEREIAGPIRPHQRRARLERGFRADHRRLRLPA